MVDISGALKNPGTVYRFCETHEFEPTTFMGEEIAFTSAEHSGEFFGTGEGISIRGTVNVTVLAHCGRCLEDVEYHIGTETRGDFSRTADGSDVYPITGHEIDVTQAAYEAVMLEMPMRFLCSTNCRGLCPVCGKNRNFSLCTCLEGVQKGNAFSALSSLLTDHNNEEV